VADEFEKLLKAYESTVKACLDNAQSNIDASRDSWSKLKTDEYKASTMLKDSVDMYARSINVYRQMMNEWMRVDEEE